MCAGAGRGPHDSRLFHVKQLPKDSFPLTPDAFRQATNVSRETIDRLKALEALLRRWQKRVNLVAASTLDDIWGRHFLDSAQLLRRYREEHPGEGPAIWLDLGSGAGFPGLVLAILGVGEVHLVESNGRKCTFLRRVINQTGAEAVVHQSRIEALDSFPVDVITARALAPISKILAYGEKFGGNGAEYWLLKGSGAQRELTEAGKYWKLDWRSFPSITDDSGAVLRLRECKRVEQA